MEVGSEILHFALLEGTSRYTLQLLKIILSYICYYDKDYIVIEIIKNKEIWIKTIIDKEKILPKHMLCLTANNKPQC